VERVAPAERSDLRAIALRALARFLIVRPTQATTVVPRQHTVAAVGGADTTFTECLDVAAGAKPCAVGRLRRLRAGRWQRVFAGILDAGALRPG